MENTQTTTDEAHINIFIPMTIKRRRGNVPTIILPKDKTLEVTNSNYDYNLINAIVKAYRLQKKLDKNPKMTIAELATKDGLTKGYVGRLMRLNLLAPDIVEAILFGKQPRELKLQDLLRKEIPHIWQEQREKLKF
jgi:hypothetical protein